MLDNNGSESILRKKWENKLEKIEQDIRQYGETIYNRATDNDIKCFDEWWNKYVKKINVPQEFYDFTSLANGFEYDGLLFCSINQEENNNIYETNNIYWENDNLRQYIFWGEDSISWYCQSVETKEFLILDKPSGERMESFGSFGELINEGLDSVCE